MKWLWNIIGVLLLLFGVVWILQGTNVLPVGFMAGQIQYAVLGIVVVILGAGLLVFTNRRRPAASGQVSAKTKR